MSARRTPVYQAAEHEFEAQRGLPEPLPPGERLLWQGAPDWRVLAREALHTRALALYFGGLSLWRGATLWSAGADLADTALGVGWMLLLALLALSLLTTIAWLIGRTSVYTLTDRRVVMRIGVVLGISFNLPYSRIDSAALRTNRDGSGDLSLVLDQADHIAYLHLWPHARPWQLKRTQPMLRALPQAQHVADLLSAALVEAADAGRAEPPVRMPTPVPVPVRLPSGAVSRDCSSALAA